MPFLRVPVPLLRNQLQYLFTNDSKVSIIQLFLHNVEGNLVDAWQFRYSIMRVKKSSRGLADVVGGSSMSKS